MKKDEAIEELRRTESSLKVAKIISEENEKAIKEIKEDIEKLKAIINKKDSWRSVRVSDSWEELYEEKALLMADMMHFAYVRNEGWVPDWENSLSKNWGLELDGTEGVYPDYYFCLNCFVFGIAVKSEEIAQEMLTEFGDRIKKIYNKQY